MRLNSSRPPELSVALEHQRRSLTSSPPVHRGPPCLSLRVAAPWTYTLSPQRGGTAEGVPPHPGWLPPEPRQNLLHRSAKLEQLGHWSGH